ncbi:MAG TPA: hypothetical protein VGO31_07615 [Microbacteriaceae bacterium]|nr:hypothetical protein [Microbacteriaceae bacterium]
MSLSDDAVKGGLLAGAAIGDRSPHHVDVTSRQLYVSESLMRNALRAIAEKPEFHFTVQVFAPSPEVPAEPKLRNAMRWPREQWTSGDPSGVDLGLPLSWSISGHEWKVIIIRDLVLAHHPDYRQYADRALGRLGQYARGEETLWANQGWRVPYAASVGQLECLTRSEGELRHDDLLVCLACGDLGVVRRRQPGATPRRVCKPCAMARRSDRSDDWPEGVTMPTQRGVGAGWWIDCGECGLPFEGRADARSCPGHRKSATTASRRRGADRDES